MDRHRDLGHVASRQHAEGPHGQILHQSVGVHRHALVAHPTEGLVHRAEAVGTQRGLIENFPRPHLHVDPFARFDTHARPASASPGHLDRDPVAGRAVRPGPP